VDPRLAARFITDAPGHFAALWPHVRAEAEAREHDAKRKLKLRGDNESAELRRLLEQQLADAQKVLNAQLTFNFVESEADQREQLARDRRHIRDRVSAIGRELIEEPQQIIDSYAVARELLLPVGLVYLWPTTR
jgi:3-deoxy-D-arabino-heptulosonate 7-phosphate (DAHP) synthase class II